MSVNGTLVEAKICTFIIESTHFVLNKCPLCTHDGAIAKFRTNSNGNVGERNTLDLVGLGNRGLIVRNPSPLHVLHFYKKYLPGAVLYVFSLWI